MGNIQYILNTKYICINIDVILETELETYVYNTFKRIAIYFSFDDEAALELYGCVCVQTFASTSR